MGCCLIVANRSMAGRRLREKLLTLHLEDPTTEFHVVVPARGLEFYDLAWASGFGMPSPVASALETIGIAPTQARLDAMLADLRAFGLHISGELGPAPPLVAIESRLHEAPYDQIIISTLPETFSRWLRMDLPRRTRRRFGLPVTTVVHDVDDPNVDGPDAFGTTGPIERAMLRAVATEHPVQVLVIDADARAASLTAAAFDRIGLCAVHRSRTNNESLEYLRREGRFAGCARADLVVVASESVSHAGAPWTDVTDEVNAQQLPLLLVDDLIWNQTREQADKIHAWAFVPLSSRYEENDSILEGMLVELAVLEHRRLGAQAV